MTMISLSFELVGVSPLGFSAPVRSEKLDKETHPAFEERTWREKMHVDDSGQVFIPPMALKNALAHIAKYLSEKIPGKRNATFTKHFEAGIIVPEPLMLGVKVDDVQPQRVFVPSDGKKGGGARVWKLFPVIPTWKTQTTIAILDDLLVAHIDKVKEYVDKAGKFSGLLWFRPNRGGYYGRYNAQNFKEGKV
jgi:hypothetical protein